MEKMTWEETIEYIRKEDSFKDLVRDAYFDPNLKANVERYYSGEEYLEIKKLIQTEYKNIQNTKITDLGAGNGIAAVSFARDGMNVIAVEPDASETIGAGAIKKLKEEYQLDNLQVIEAYGEDMDIEEGSQDIVFTRQAMHHANDLNQFILECTRILKKDGLLITVRDHVVDNEQDLETFFKTHPLHKYYGGEMAYSLEQYKKAFSNAGLIIQKELTPFGSPINYAPFTTQDFRNKLRFLGKSDTALRWALKYLDYRHKRTPGRLYTFVCKKVK